MKTEGRSMGTFKSNDLSENDEQCYRGEKSTFTFASFFKELKVLM
jgi:hypothetical protein